MTTVSSSFVMHMKIRGKVIQLKLNLEDNRQSIFRKIQQTLPDICLNQQQALSKILKQLKNLTKEQEMKQSLRSMLEIFVYKIEQSCPLNQSLLPIVNKSGIRSCVSEMIETPPKSPKHISTQTQSEQDQIKVLKESLLANIDVNSIKIVKQADSSQILSKNSSHWINIKDVQNNSSSSHALNKKKAKSVCKKNCNPDIVKACQAIMKKCGQNDMRIMAKQFLRQKGVLQEQQQLVQKETRRKAFFIQQPCKKRQECNPERKNLTQILDNSNSAIVKQENSQLTKDEARKNHSIGRFKYLCPSLNDLHNKYETKHIKTENQEPKPPKKYSYLDI